MKKLKILLVASSFAPSKNMGAVRPSKLAKYFTKAGHKVTIITNSQMYYGTDEILNKDIENYGEIIKISTNSNGEIAQFIRKEFNKSKLQQKEKKVDINPGKEKKINIRKNFMSFYRKVENKTWMRTVRLKLKINEGRHWAKSAIDYIGDNFTKDEFDIVLTTFPSLSAMIVGNYVKENEISKKWIADFRDPLLRDIPNKAIENELSQFQKKICKNSDLISVVSEGIKTDLLHHNETYKIPNLTNKIKVIYNGYDIEDLEKINLNISNNGKYIISYTGMLYNGRRDLRIVIRSIKSILEKYPEYKGKIELHYAGNDSAIMARWIAEYDAENFVINHGILSRQQALELQSISNVILIVTWSGNKTFEQGVIPGKLYEAMMFNAKLVGIIITQNYDSELKNIIENNNLGIAIESADTEIVNKQTILGKFILDDLQQDDSIKMSRNYSSNFDYSNISNEMIDFLY